MNDRERGVFSVVQNLTFCLEGETLMCVKSEFDGSSYCLQFFPLKAGANHGAYIRW